MATKKRLNIHQARLAKKLTALQLKCALEYLDCGRYYLAYQRAKQGMDEYVTKESAQSAASGIFNNPNVKEFIEEMNKSVISNAIMCKTEALELLSEIGRARMSDVADFKTVVIGRDEETGEEIKQAVWTFKDSDATAEASKSSIAELTSSKDGLKIKLHNPLHAIQQLAKIQGWEAPKVIEQTGVDGTPLHPEKLNIDLTSQDIKDAVNSLMSRL